MCKEHERRREKVERDWSFWAVKNFFDWYLLVYIITLKSISSVVKLGMEPFLFEEN